MRSSYRKGLILMNLYKPLRMLFILSWMINGSGLAGVPKFQSERAYGYLTKQCDFGPRNPGSEGHVNCQMFLFQTLKSCADTVMLQPFLFTNPKTGKMSTLNNIIGRFGKQKERILLCAHWDTRPWADRDPDPKNHSHPIRFHTRPICD